MHDFLAHDRQARLGQESVVTGTASTIGLGQRPRAADGWARRIAGASLLALALMGTSPTGALAVEPETAEPTTITSGKTGSTRVTVVADDENLRFRVPTLIPFVAASDGTLTGPTTESTRIENLSAYGLKVTNVRVATQNGWTHGSDVSASDDSISWYIGPRGAEVDGGAATADTGTDITSPLWNMTYHSDATETDDILLNTDGMVGRVAQDISSPVQVGTVTFTLAPGAHADGPQKPVVPEEPDKENPEQPNPEKPESPDAEKPETTEKPTKSDVETPQKPETPDAETPQKPNAKTPPANGGEGTAEVE